MTDTVTITLSLEDANELIAAASNVLARLDHSIDNGEYISVSWQELAKQRRDRLYGAAREIRHRIGLESYFDWKYSQK